MDAAAEALLEVLPPAAAKAMRKAFAEHRGTYEFTECFDEACRAVGYPSRQSHPPLIAELTPVQHALAQLVCDEPFDAPSHIPPNITDRRRWLGLDAPGRFDRTVRLPDNRDVPLWYALHVLPRSDEVEPSRETIMRQFSVEERLRMLDELSQERAAPYGVDAYDVFPPFPELLDQLAGQAREILPEVANRLVDRFDPEHYRFPVFVGLVRAGIPIAPAWDKLLPVSPWPSQRPFMFECARAIPDERRDAAMAGAIDREVWKVPIGCVLLQEFPSAVPVAQQILQWVPYADAPVKHRAKEVLAEVAAVSPQVAALVGGTKPKPLKQITVTCTRAFKPKTLGDLSKAQQAQLVKAGKLWDGANVAAAKRLSKDKHDEHNLAGTLEVRELADAKGNHAYDAFTYAGDSGTIFKASTTTVVAEIVQGGLECKNETLGDALEAALEAKPQKASAKKPAAKKPAAKKSPKKKPAVKKPAKRK